VNVEVQGNGTVQVHSTQEWISRVTAEGDHGKHSRDSPLYINAHRDEDIEVTFVNGGDQAVYISWKDNAHRQQAFPPSEFVQHVARVGVGRSHVENTRLGHVFRLTHDVLESSILEQQLEVQRTDVWWHGYAVGLIAVLLLSLLWCQASQWKAFFSDMFESILGVAWNKKA